MLYVLTRTFNNNIKICFTEKKANNTCTNSKECGAKLLCEDEVCQCPVDFFWNENKCILSKLCTY